MSEVGPPDDLPTAEQPTAEQPRPNSHRATEPDRPLASRLLAPLGAVAVVVAVIVALILINGHNPSSAGDVATSAIHPSGLGPSGPLGATPTAAHRHRHHRASGGAGSASPASSPAPSLGPSTPASPPATGSRTDAAPTAMAMVQVLNNSRITGLAHAVAAAVQAKGWTVTNVGNLQGVIAASTVYYSPGDRAAARHLAEQFDAVQRVLPERDAGLTSSGLTLVLTRYWSG